MLPALCFHPVDFDGCPTPVAQFNDCVDLEAVSIAVVVEWLGRGTRKGACVNTQVVDCKGFEERAK